MTYTYIMKSHDLYKIGKAINVEERLKSFQCGNPYIEVVKTIEGNYESYLHRHYKNKRIRNEWFQLTDEDVDNIEKIVGSVDPYQDSLESGKYITVMNRDTGTNEKISVVNPKCPCKHGFDVNMLALMFTGVKGDYDAIRKRAAMTGNYNYEVWVDDLLADTCKSGIGKEILKITVTGFEDNISQKTEGEQKEEKVMNLYTNDV